MQLACCITSPPVLPLISTTTSINKPAINNDNLPLHCCFSGCSVMENLLSFFVWSVDGALSGFYVFLNASS